jgi:hypothetical protein
MHCLLPITRHPHTQGHAELVLVLHESAVLGWVFALQSALQQVRREVVWRHKRPRVRGLIRRVLASVGRVGGSRRRLALVVALPVAINSLVL